MSVLVETSITLRDIRNNWKEARRYGRLSRIPDIGTQLFPLDCADKIECLWTPPYFWKFCLWMNPLQGFWPYQVLAFDHFFHCWYARLDGTLRQARQTGKSTTMPLPLSFLIQEEHVQLVVLSTNVTKTRKITRPIRKAMSRMEWNLEVDSLEESRFDDDTGYRAMSGQPDAKKESETANIVLVDESQDVPYSPTYKEVSAMRKGVGGIMFAMGIGGPDDSLMMGMVDQHDTLNLNIKYNEIPERPQYRADVEVDKLKMLSFEFSANYEGERTSRKSNALIDNLIEWSEMFPNTEFTPDLLSDIEIGFDFAQVQDDTCAVASGVYGDIHVIHEYDYYPKGEATEVQIDGLVRFMMRVDFNRLRPEANNLGRRLIEEMTTKLDIELRKLKWSGTIDEIWHPVTTNEYNIDAAIRAIHELSASKRLVYVDNGKNPHVKRCIKGLRAVGVKKGGKGLLKSDHSDWMAAFRTRYCGRRVARVAA